MTFGRQCTYGLQWCAVLDGGLCLPVERQTPSQLQVAHCNLVNKSVELCGLATAIPPMAKLLGLVCSCVCLPSVWSLHYSFLMLTSPTSAKKYVFTPMHSTLFSWAWSDTVEFLLAEFIYSRLQRLSCCRLVFCFFSALNGSLVVIVAVVI